MNSLDEKSMQVLENNIPKLAEGAVRQAYVQALATGSSVIEVVDGKLVETQADGTFKVLQTIAAGTPVKPGSKIRLQA